MGYLDEMRCEDLIVHMMKKLDGRYERKKGEFVKDYSKFIESYMDTLFGEETGKIAAHHMIYRLRSMMW